MCQNDSIHILPQFGSEIFFHIIKSMKLTKLGCYLLVFRANLKAFSHILTTNNIYNGHIYVRKSHLEPRKKLIFLPQNQPCIPYLDCCASIKYFHKTENINPCIPFAKSLKIEKGFYVVEFIEVMSVDRDL